MNQLQDVLLDLLEKNKIDVKIFLVNGVLVKGVIKAFDAYIIVVEDEKQQSIIYKHAISTIIPSVNPYGEAESK